MIESLELVRASTALFSFQILGAGLAIAFGICFLRYRSSTQRAVREAQMETQYHILAARMHR